MITFPISYKIYSEWDYQLFSVLIRLRRSLAQWRRWCYPLRDFPGQIWRNVDVIKGKHYEPRPELLSRLHEPSKSDVPKRQYPIF